MLWFLSVWGYPRLDTQRPSLLQGVSFYAIFLLCLTDTCWNTECFYSFRNTLQWFPIIPDSPCRSTFYPIPKSLPYPSNHTSNGDTITPPYDTSLSQRYGRSIRLGFGFHTRNISAKSDNSRTLSVGGYASHSGALPPVSPIAQ